MGLSANDGKSKKQKQENKKRFHWFTMTFQIEIASLGYTPTFRHVQTMKIGPSRWPLQTRPHHRIQPEGPAHGDQEQEPLA